MFLINPTITPNILNSDGYNDILERIDRRIALIAKNQYLNDSYAFKYRVDLDLYDRLCEYKEILLDKLMGCNCLTDEYLIFIISKIQKLTN